MKLLDGAETIVLVTGTTESAERGDRPVALYLQREIDTRGGGHPYRRAVVMGDVDYMDRPQLHNNPTIAIGGPGVNGVAQHFASELAMVWQRDERVFIQAEFEAEVKRAAVWGNDAAATSAAVDAFVAQGFLDLLLERIWRIRAQVNM